MLSKGQLQRTEGMAQPCLMGVTQDITARKVMEQKMQEHLQEIEFLRQKLEAENALLKSEAGKALNTQSPLGASRAMRQIMTKIELVAPTQSTVLIQGETGTGKELIAQTIHRLSDRSKHPMVTVNCAALPAALVESELFGRERGAFTGAVSKQVGRFELADRSTLFLDEVAEMPLETQAKLLRVLQEGKFERLGSPHSVKVDVRIIAATNKTLYEEVEKGNFRRDLFYRLSIFPIHVPPLRERTEDIPHLVWKFVNEFGEKMGKRINRVPQKDMEKLTGYTWPGNIRELKNVIEYGLIVSKGEVLELSLQHFELQAECTGSGTQTLEEVEREHIQKTLQLTKGRIKGKGGAAQLLGMNPSTLYSRMRKLDISSTKPKPQEVVS
ncbi:regulatory protein, Fis family [Desulfopila aestuarii DSM 18488]|uniref:Regulatory protein, Fis family n=2 Tax=Desulfopila aestuarii TaxID=231440 RepID=A0A1M7YKY3_9BACT|nr:regulatory protein, Fis family [Desulfopila aestuarii DSM 18488]